MARSQNVKKEIAKLKIKLSSKDPCAASNLAVIYRKLGNRKRAFFWWKRATETWDDGDSFLEMAYCFQYGLGVRLNKNEAIQNYWNAIHANNCTKYGCEEAKYHLAIALLDAGENFAIKRTVKKLLMEAAADGDFPQALDLLEEVSKKTPRQLCRCRRGLLQSLGGKSQCRLHRPRKRLHIPRHKQSIGPIVLRPQRFLRRTRRPLDQKKLKVGLVHPGRTD